jgi:hypothetical protein
LLVADTTDIRDPLNPVPYPDASEDRCSDLTAVGIPCIKAYHAPGNQASTRAAITNQTETGALVLNYYGSASTRQWGFDIFNDRPEIDALLNGTAQPFVMSHGTQNALYAAPGLVSNVSSIVESYIRLAGNGAVASAGSAGGTNLGDLRVFGSKLFDELFVQNTLSLGEAFRLAKNRSITEGAVPDDSLRALNFFGDPATLLARDRDGDLQTDFDDCAPSNGALATSADAPGAPDNSLEFVNDTDMTWGIAPKASAYNLYQGTLTAGAPWAWNQACVVSGLGVRAYTDNSTPAAAGEVDFFLPTGVNSCGEGNFGLTSISALRDNAITACVLSSGDEDSDGVLNQDDNCADMSNAGQEDAELDNFGDICDNCPNDYNPSQSDQNGNGIGDACEA